MTTATVEVPSVSVGRERPWISLAARLTLAAIFLLAGLPKLGDLTQSGRAVNAYEIFPTQVANIIGYALPPFEVALGVLLLIGLFTRLSAWVSAFVLTAFVLGIASVWVRGLSIECGCFNAGGAVAGSPPYQEYAREILRDLALIAVSAWLIKFPKSPFSVDNWLQPQVPEEIES